jgi:hypothetical protein
MEQVRYRATVKDFTGLDHTVIIIIIIIMEILKAKLRGLNP